MKLLALLFALLPSSALAATTTAAGKVSAAAAATSTFTTVNVTTGTISGQLTVGGRLGVGTTSPSSKLHVKESGATGTMLLENSSAAGFVTMDFRDNSAALKAYLGWSNSGTGFFGDSMLLATDGTKDLNILTNSTERLKIHAGGNISMGAPGGTPDRKLDILQTGAVGSVKVRNSSADGYSSIDFFDNSNTLSASVGFGNPSASAPVLADKGYLGTNSAKHFVFFTGGEANERMRITSVGDVGIGTTNPATKLDIEGTAQFGTTGKSTFTAAGFLYIPDGSAATPSLAFGNFTSFGLFRSGVNIGIATLGAEVARFTDGGRFGLGTQSPQTMLDVEGTAQFGATAKSTFTAAGLLYMTAGSASAPSLVIGGASIPSLGLFKAGTDIGFAGLGSETMRLTGSGNLGIGMTPTEKLDVTGNIRATGTVSAGSGTNTVYYCTGSTAGTFDGNLARGNSNAGACAGGTWVATSLRVD